MRFSPIPAILTLIFIIGCASPSPVITDLSPGKVDHSAASGNSNHVLWGVWDVSIDPDTLDDGINPAEPAVKYPSSGPDGINDWVVIETSSIIDMHN